MKDSKRSSSTYTESLFLHVVKHNFFFLFQFFFLSVFFNEYSRFTRQQLKGQTLSAYILSATSTCFTGTYTLAGLLLQKTDLCAQLAAGIKHEIFGTSSLEFTLSTLVLVAAVLFCFFFLSGFYFTNIQGKEEGISLTHHYQFHPLHIHLHISRTITAESSPLHIASSRTQTGNLWFPSTRC